MFTASKESKGDVRWCICERAVGDL